MTPLTSDPVAAKDDAGHARAATTVTRMTKRPTKPIVGSVGRRRDFLLDVPGLRQVVLRDLSGRLLVDVDTRVQLLHRLGREALLHELDRLARIETERAQRVGL